MNAARWSRLGFLFLGIVLITLPIIVFLSQRHQRMPQNAAEKSVTLPTSAAGLPTHTAGKRVTFTPTVLPLTGTEIANPFRGQYVWYNRMLVPPPWPVVDSYARYPWVSLEPTENHYNFSAIDKELAAAKARGGKFGFRVMAVSGGGCLVPSYLMRRMPHAFTSNGMCVPDWNDPAFLARAQALIAALAGRYNNDPRLGWVEVGFYGNYGEWQLGGMPARTAKMTAANKRALIAMVVKAFSHKRIMQMVNDSDGINFALSLSPKIGWRYDCLGSSTMGWISEYGTRFLDRWKTAPLLGEFCGLPSSDIQRASAQSKQYHIAMVDGNNQPWTSYNSSDQAAIETIMKQIGYRIYLTRLSLPYAITTGTPFRATTGWSNVNLTPAYTPWNIMIQLKNSSGTLAWQGKSQFDLQTLLPTNSSGINVPVTVNDMFTLPTKIASGRYTVALQIVDPESYYAPFALANTGRQNDGSYDLGQITVTGGNISHGHPAYTASLTPLPVVCGLGILCLISGVYSELFELMFSLFGGFKTRHNPKSTNYRYSAVQKY